MNSLVGSYSSRTNRIWMRNENENGSSIDHDRYVNIRYRCWKLNDEYQTNG